MNRPLIERPKLNANAKRSLPLKITIALITVAAVVIGIVSSLWIELAIIGFAAVVLLLIAGIILIKPARVFFVFLLLLPSYQLTMMLLLHFSGSPTLVKLAQPWKEVLALLTLGIIIVSFISSNRWFRWNVLDLLMVVFLGMNLIYVLRPGNTTVVARLFGMRANAFLVVLYFIGRMVPMSRRRQRQIIRGLLLLAILAGIFALIDYLLLPVAWPARIGLRNYLALVSDSTVVSAAPMELTWTFWTATGLRRVSAFFANPLDLAASIHLMGVTALVIMLYQPKLTWKKIFLFLIFGLSVLAILLSISRASIAIFFLEILLVAILTRRYSFVVYVVVAGVIGLSLAILLIPDMGRFLFDTITFQNPSSQGHLEGWIEGLNAIGGNLLGLGLATSSQVGGRFGTSIGRENQYIIYGVELGILGMLLYISILVLSVLMALKLFRKSEGVTQQLALIAAVSRIGLAGVGLTSHIELYVFTTFISWWLMGLVSQLLAQSKYKDKVKQVELPMAIAEG